MAKLILLNKPFRVLSQFTDDLGRDTLARFVHEPDVYAAGRLDYDSEGLLLLCSDGRLQQRIADPRHKLWKRYYLQLDGEISDDAIVRLRSGVTLKDGPTRPARVKRIAPPKLWPRDPPIRVRRQQPTSWIEIAIQEGRNRQLRRMAAAVNYPVLRLVRWAIGDWELGDLLPGESRCIDVHLPREQSSNNRRNRGTTRR